MNGHELDPNRNGHADSGVCAEYRDRVSAAHDGELLGAEGSDVDVLLSRHALLCESCREFERRLPGVAAEFAVLRGTPVRDLWPALSDEAARTRGFARPRASAALAAAAAGALATWGLLSWLAAEHARQAGAASSVERALATISSESSGQAELARLFDTPELRLLAHLGAAKEDVR